MYPCLKITACDGYVLVIVEHQLSLDSHTAISLFVTRCALLLFGERIAIFSIIAPHPQDKKHNSRIMLPVLSSLYQYK